MNTQFMSREQVREVDRRAVTEYGMCSLVLMENAGRGCADTLCRLGVEGPVAICCGKGNNAGDGFVIARHLDLRGKAVEVLLWSSPDRLQGDALQNYNILCRAQIPITVFGSSHDPARLAEHLQAAQWVVDALLGTGVQGEPRPPLDTVIEQLNAHPATKLAVDLPSGLDCDTGQPAAPTFRADHTCTFVAMKAGFAAQVAQPFLGQVHVLDIGAPRKLIEQLGQAC